MNKNTSYSCMIYILLIQIIKEVYICGGKRKEEKDLVQLLLLIS